MMRDVASTIGAPSYLGLREPQADAGEDDDIVEDTVDKREPKKKGKKKGKKGKERKSQS
jgi:hypothetical protein